MCQKNSRRVKRRRKYCYKVMSTNNGFRTPYASMPMDECTERWQNVKGWIPPEDFDDEHHKDRISVLKTKDDAEKYASNISLLSNQREIWKVEVRDEYVYEGDFCIGFQWVKTWLVDEIRFVKKVM